MKWSIDEISDKISFFAIPFLAFGIFNLVLCVLALLFRGKFILSLVLVSVGWVGFGLCVLFEARKIKANQVNDIAFIFVNIYEILFWIFWWLTRPHFPYNVICGVLGGALFLFFKLSWYKMLKKQIAARKIK